MTTDHTPPDSQGPMAPIPPYGWVAYNAPCDTCEQRGKTSQLDRIETKLDRVLRIAEGRLRFTTNAPPSSGTPVLVENGHWTEADRKRHQQLYLAPETTDEPKPNRWKTAAFWAALGFAAVAAGSLWLWVHFIRLAAG